MKKQKAEYRVATGATSMLMIFVVLCLTTLAILSYASARADLTMTLRSRSMVTEYYDGAAAVQEALADLDDQLEPLQKASADQAAYDRAAEGLTQALGLPLDHPQPGILAFSVPAGHQREIDVRVALLPPGSAEGRYEVVSHILRYGGDWTPQDDLTLYGTDEAEAMEAGAAPPTPAPVSENDSTFEYLD